MFHKRLNELRLTVNLRPSAPLLIKAGEDPLSVLETISRSDSSALSFSELTDKLYGEIAQRSDADRERRQAKKQQRADERGNTYNEAGKLDADMKFVTTLRNGETQPYLPGSSLKGVLRNRCGQLANTFLPTGKVCNIFHEANDDTDHQSCTKKIEALKDSARRYQTACTICKIFGCGGLSSRIAIGDAYLTTPLSPYGVRNGVGIDRRRGAAAPGALFQFEVLEQGAFQLSMTLENFERWQLGLLAFALDALFTADLPIGYGARRGMGRLQGEISEATLTYFDVGSRSDQVCRLRGAYALSTSEAQDKYQLVHEDAAVDLPQAQRIVQGLRRSWRLGAKDIETLWSAGAEAWQSYIQTAIKEQVA